MTIVNEVSVSRPSPRLLFCLSLRIMLNYNMRSLAFSPISEQNPIEAYGNMLHSDGFISVSGINRRKICRSRMVRDYNDVTT